MGPFLKITKNMQIDPNWTHIRRIGLRIKDFESQSRYQSNGTTGDPQNCHIKFKIDQKNPRPNRPNCTLNYSVNRATFVISMHWNIWYHLKLLTWRSYFLLPTSGRETAESRCGCAYGWRNNLVYTVPGWIHWIFGRFWILYGSFGVPEGSHWIHSTFKFQMAWFSAREVEYGSSSDRFSWFSDFSEKSGRLPDTVFVVFSGRGFQIRIFEVFGRNQKEPRRKVTQIRGGITSRSAFFGRFVPI